MNSEIKPTIIVCLETARNSDLSLLYACHLAKKSNFAVQILVVIGQPMWHTPPLSSVVLVEGVILLVLAYLYLNMGSLSRIPHEEPPMFEG